MERELIWHYPGHGSPWCDIFNSELDYGMYFGLHDVKPRTCTLRFALHPTPIDSLHRKGNWPEKQDFAVDTPIGLKINWVKFPYVRPGESFITPPVILWFHRGDWHAGAKFYRKWFDTHTDISKNKGWLRSSTALQSTILYEPEDRVNYKFQDIPKLAEDAKKYGVNIVHMLGWSKGGLDRDDPDYSPEEKLGGEKELIKAIRKVHSLGSKIMLMANVHDINTTHAWYDKELKNYLVMGPFGKTNQLCPSWGEGTLAARFRWTGQERAFLSPANKRFQKIIIKEFIEIAKLGTDAIHVDKMWGGGLDFSQIDKLSPDIPLSVSLYELFKAIYLACKKVNPEICFCAETIWDRLFEFVDVVWASSDALSINHTPVMKYTFPEWGGLGIHINYPNYHSVNSCMRFGYNMMIEPKNLLKTMDDEMFRPFSLYVKELLKIRQALKDTIVTGDFLDTLEVKVKVISDNKDAVRYNGHQNYMTKKRCCIVENISSDVATVSVEFENNKEGECLIYQPAKEKIKSFLSKPIEIPVDRIAVVLEL